MHGFEVSSAWLLGEVLVGLGLSVPHAHQLNRPPGLVFPFRTAPFPAVPFPWDHFPK